MGLPSFPNLLSQSGGRAKCGVICSIARLFSTRLIVRPRIHQRGSPDAEPATSSRTRLPLTSKAEPFAGASAPIHDRTKPSPECAFAVVAAPTTDWRDPSVVQLADPPRPTPFATPPTPVSLLRSVPLPGDIVNSVDRSFVLDTNGGVTTALKQAFALQPAVEHRSVQVVIEITTLDRRKVIRDSFRVCVKGVSCPIRECEWDMRGGFTKGGHGEFTNALSPIFFPFSQLRPPSAGARTRKSEVDGSAPPFSCPVRARGCCAITFAPHPLGGRSRPKYLRTVSINPVTHSS